MKEVNENVPTVDDEGSASLAVDVGANPTNEPQHRPRVRYFHVGPFDVVEVSQITYIFALTMNQLSLFHGGCCMQSIYIGLNRPPM